MTQRWLLWIACWLVAGVKGIGRPGGGMSIVRNAAGRQGLFRGCGWTGSLLAPGVLGCVLEACAVGSSGQPVGGRHDVCWAKFRSSLVSVAFISKVLSGAAVSAFWAEVEMTECRPICDLGNVDLANANAGRGVPANGHASRAELDLGESSRGKSVICPDFVDEVAGQLLAGAGFSALPRISSGTECGERGWAADMSQSECPVCPGCRWASPVPCSWRGRGTATTSTSAELDRFPRGTAPRSGLGPTSGAPEFRRRGHATAIPHP